MWKQKISYGRLQLAWALMADWRSEPTLVVPDPQNGNDFHESVAGTEVAFYPRMIKLQLLQGYTCTRCGEFFTSTTVDERQVHVALFGMTDQVCPICYSTPEDREGRELPPPKET